MHFAIIRQMRKTLAQLETWLDAAAAFAAKKSFDPNVFIGLRLAPDQFPFVRQIQSSCDTVKLAAARLAGQEAPKHADTEQTLEELRARVKSVLAYVDGFSATDYAEAGSRTVTTPRWEGKTMTATDYLLEHALPNFYFHTTHAYAILRHNGVELGKRDFLGPLSFRVPA
jgi:uncharacterized protein